MTASWNNKLVERRWKLVDISQYNSIFFKHEATKSNYGKFTH